MEISASSPFSRAFDYASDQTGRRFQNPVYFITEIFAGSRFRSSLTEVKKFGQQIVLNAHKRRNQHERVDRTFDPGCGSLIDSLMEAFDGNPHLTADAALNFLSAGRDTTAQSLAWTSYSLMRHPSAVATLREEIESTFLFHAPARRMTVDRSLPTGPLQLSVADLQPTVLPRVMSIFNESLRLHPPVPFEIKQCQIDTTLPDGTFLPKESIVVWCIWAINRSREIWGDDSDTFRPERWLSPAAAADAEDDNDNKALKLIAKSPFEFPVFNAGPRSCLGKKMAELMACWVLVQMWGEFDFEETLNENEAAAAVSAAGPSKEERRSQNSLTLPMEGGLPCYVRLR